MYRKTIARKLQSVYCHHRNLLSIALFRQSREKSDSFSNEQPISKEVRSWEI